MKATGLIIILSIANAAVSGITENWDGMAGWISATFGWMVVLGKEMKEALK